MRTLMLHPGASHRAVRRGAAGYRHGTVTDALRSMVATGQVLRVEPTSYGAPAAFYALDRDGAPVLRFGASARTQIRPPRRDLTQLGGDS